MTPDPADVTTEDDDEQTARSIVRRWMAFLGYEDQQIAEAELDRDHSACEFIGGVGWDCGDEEGKSRHPIHDETDATAALVMFTLEALAGRLLPEGGTERTEWQVIYRDGVGAKVVWAQRDTAEGAEESFTSAHDQGWPYPELHSRTVTHYPDGSVLTGAWVEVLDGTEAACTKGGQS